MVKQKVRPPRYGDAPKKLLEDLDREFLEMFRSYKVYNLLYEHSIKKNLGAVK